MSFRYIFGQERPRDELDNKVIDEVVGGILISSNLRPTTNPLKDLHKWTAIQYSRAKHKLEEKFSVRSSWVWKKTKWMKKKDV